MATPDPLDTTRYEHELARTQGGVERELGTVAGIEEQRAQNLDAKEKATAEPRAAAAKEAGELSDLAKQPAPASEASGMTFLPHELDPKEIQGFSWALIGLALVGGAVSHGNWLGVSSSLNGALKGFIDGDKTRSEREWQDFTRKFEVAEKHDKAALDRLQKAMENKNLSLNAKMQQFQLIAAEYDMKDLAEATRIKSHDAVIKQYESRVTALEGLISRKENLRASLGAAMERKKAQPGGDVVMDPEAKIAFNVVNEKTAGKSDLVKPVNSRFSHAWAVPNFNSLYASIKAKNPDMTPEQIGLELVQNAIKYPGDIAAYRTNTVRSVGVARLALSVQGMEKKVIAAAEKYGVSDARWANKTLNAVRDKLGDADYSKFRTEIVATARQYIEVVTMPGSNAQLHASSQETADKMISDDMTIGQIKGAFEGFNEEIEITGAALQTINERLLDSLGKKELKGLFSYTDDAAAKAADTPQGGKPYIHPSGAKVEIIN